MLGIITLKQQKFPSPDTCYLRWPERATFSDSAPVPKFFKSEPENNGKDPCLYTHAQIVTLHITRVYERYCTSHPGPKDESTYQNRRQEVFNRGLCSCAGVLTF